MWKKVLELIFLFFGLETTFKISTEEYNLKLPSFYRKATHSHVSADEKFSLSQCDRTYQNIKYIPSDLFQNKMLQNGLSIYTNSLELSVV